jgi:hypothetical protein
MVKGWHFLESVGSLPRDIDLIVLATLSPDFNFPGTSVFVHRALGRPEPAGWSPGRTRAGSSHPATLPISSR